MIFNYHQLILFIAAHQITTLLPVIFNRFDAKGVILNK